MVLKCSVVMVNRVDKGSTHFVIIFSFSQHAEKRQTKRRLDELRSDIALLFIRRPKQGQSRPFMQSQIRVKPFFSVAVV